MCGSNFYETNVVYKAMRFNNHFFSRDKKLKYKLYRAHMHGFFYQFLFPALRTYCIHTWGQLIKLIQVTSNSELRENQWMTFISLKLFPLIASGP